MDSSLLVRTAELLSDGTVGSALFSGMVTVVVPTTSEYIIHVPISSKSRRGLNFKALLYLTSIQGWCL